MDATLIWLSSGIDVHSGRLWVSGVARARPVIDSAIPSKKPMGFGCDAAHCSGDIGAEAGALAIAADDACLDWDASHSSGLIWPPRIAYMRSTDYQ